MHTTNLDISLEEITKIEGAATLQLQVREGKLTQCTFAISEMRRFFTQALRGKPVSGVPAAVARICGTCSNAHLLCSLKAIEKALKLVPSDQTMLLRKLLNYGLIIRDHGLHLYVFVLPDLFAKDSILAFDENDPVQHELVHDCFAVKNIGNKLAIAAGGRSVHAPFARIGGFSQLPTKEDLQALLPLLSEIRPRVLRLIDVFVNCTFELKQELKFLALTDSEFSFLGGVVKTSNGTTIDENDFAKTLQRVDIPHSQATGYLFDGHIHFVGALARVNLNKDALHPTTQKDAQKALSLFPSNNIYHNNLAQAIEMLHAIDASIDLIGNYQAQVETLPVLPTTGGVGHTVIEAPRGTLFHSLAITAENTVSQAAVIVPTGQNQIGIEKSIHDWVEQNLDKPKEEIEKEAQKIIRAYDPCMSCATHFLKVQWS